MRTRHVLSAALTVLVLAAPAAAHAAPHPARAQAHPAAEDRDPGTVADAAAQLAESRTDLAAAAAALAATQRRVAGVRDELASARSALHAARRQVQAATVAADRARQQEVAATLELATVGYQAQTSRVALTSLVRAQYTDSTAALLPDFTWLVDSNPRALADATAAQHAERQVTATQSSALADLRAATESSRSLTDAAAAARRGRDAALAAAQTARDRSATLVAEIASVTTELDRLAAVRAKAVTEAARLVAADRDRVAALEAEAAQMERALSTAVTRLSPKARKLLASTAGTLTRPATGTVTSPYGMRFHPVLRYTKLHTGTDYSVGDGNVYAAADAVVLSTGFHTAYGNLTVLSHGKVDGKTLETWYAHQDTVAVKAGDLVAQGQPIGRIGSTGYSTGPHLHFEVRLDQDTLDPEVVLASAAGPAGSRR